MRWESRIPQKIRTMQVRDLLVKHCQMLARLLTLSILKMSFAVVAVNIIVSSVRLPKMIDERPLCDIYGVC